jgi:hypothetical protein
MRRAARDARIRQQAERQAANEQARRPLRRPEPNNLPGQPIRPRWSNVERKEP